MIKTLSNLGKEADFVDLIKDKYQKTYTEKMLNITNYLKTAKQNYSEIPIHIH